jgi:hypothetical protein
MLGNIYPGTSRVKKLFRIVALSFVFLLIGCSNQKQTSEIQTEVTVENNNDENTFLGSWSQADQAASKKAFEELDSDADEFTKEFYLNDSSYKPDIQLRKDLLYFDFFLYKKGKESEYKPQMTLQYISDDWLFMKSIFFKIGEDVIEIEPAQPNFEKTIDGGFVLEIAVFEFDDIHVEFLSRALTERLDIRVKGAQSYEETSLTSQERYSLVRSLQAYKYTKQENVK